MLYNYLRQRDLAALALPPFSPPARPLACTSVSLGSSGSGVPSNRFSPMARLTTLAAVAVKSNFFPCDLIFMAYDAAHYGGVLAFQQKGDSSSPQTGVALLTLDSA